MTARQSTLRYPVNGEEIAVRGARHLNCSKCGETVLRRHEARALRENAQNVYRTRHRLLSPTDIRAIRERVDLTQAEMARILRLGGNTLSRWESGRNVQSGAMDALLRIIRDLPESLAYLRKSIA